ncbi:tRNA 2-selenouridine(34) synthase MnmH [Rhodalgimonas zhirmunskyi]|uniref:tRNA 2-selenouridine(34) synthase MnmH n=1 Tax=Rhodalgimonas zhirmunskyi TaxID=2964767 RepID=A0AAJ1UG64_9RHOB|nr:tRNA 2-selenouridine(34) synthase MnmH [Rhodoalgimonas zhirmunskyi]MDQ2095486.1 tRNA 2-selenouridine(34) synthase MnmH [Rhodoalgimonas zhirmunskyi]
MPITLTSLRAIRDLPFDRVIDVRSPAEYAEDHIPGAINLPALSNEERARVGTIYVQQDRFLARKVGAALVARNVADHLEQRLSEEDGGWRPLVYCWRGGQRSGSFASILKQIGWRADTIEGGYRHYRQLVVKALYDDPLPVRLVIIDGGTGTAKTRLLHALQTEGAQMIDLEGLAAHRGSLFGPLLDQPQPAQKGFESALAMELVRMDPKRTVFIEAESTRIGSIILPPQLAAAMRAAPRLRITAPMGARVSHLVSEYADLIAAPEALDKVLGQLVRYHGHARVADWRALAASGDMAQLTRELIEQHYDPRYVKMPKGSESNDLPLPDLTVETLTKAARRLIADYD